MSGTETNLKNMGTHKRKIADVDNNNNNNNNKDIVDIATCKNNNNNNNNNNNFYRVWKCSKCLEFFEYSG